MENCKGLKGSDLTRCLRNNAMKRKNKKDSLIAERTRKRDSATKARHEKRIAKGKQHLSRDGKGDLFRKLTRKKKNK